MKNINTFMILTVIFTVFISCNSKTKRKGLSVFEDVDTKMIEENINDFLQVESDATTIRVPNVKEKEFLKISEIADSISFVSLSNEPEALIGTIDKIVIKEDIYVLDRYKTKALKVFDISGKYITTIGKYGGGPEEYTEPTDFLVTEKDIRIYDQFRQRIMFFDRNGTFIRSRRVPFMFIKFYMFSPNHYIFYALDADNDHLAPIVNYSVFETDSNFTVKHRGFYREKGLYASYTNETNFTPFESKIYYHPPFSDTIFAVLKTGKFSSKYIIDFGKMKLPEHYLLKKNERDFLRESKENNYAFFLGNYFVLDNQSLFFEFVIRGNVYYCLYNKGNDIKIGNIIHNDLNIVIPFGNIKGYKQNILIGYAQSVDILNRYEKFGQENFRETHSDFAGMADELKVDDNPILVFYHLKENN